MIEATVVGADFWQQRLGIDLAPHAQKGLIAIAKEAESRIAPYPRQPAPGNPWYERGYGTKYRRKDGTVTARKTSETLGRRWKIAPRGRMVVVLRNNASYASIVHAEEDQARIHEATGWQTDKDVMDEMAADGTTHDLMETALRKGLQV